LKGRTGVDPLYSSERRASARRAPGALPPKPQLEFSNHHICDLTCA
jgi:hypothetical protein